MEQRPELKQIERRAYLSYHQDGLIDICLGMVFLAFGLVTLAAAVFRSPLTGVGSIVLIRFLKTYPLPKPGETHG
jgi:hypothetical protein